MKRQGIKLFDKIIATLLALIGCEAAFTSCEYGPLMVEYGSPHANFQIKGTITAPDGKPVKGIRINGLYPSSQPDSIGVHYSDYSPQTFSDDNGQYVLRVEGGDMLLSVTDVDGPENGGSFATDTIEVPPFTAADSIPDTNEDNWDWYGNFEKNIDIQLKPTDTQK